MCSSRGFCRQWWTIASSSAHRRQQSVGSTCVRTLHPAHAPTHARSRRKKRRVRALLPALRRQPAQGSLVRAQRRGVRQKYPQRSTAQNRRPCTTASSLHRPSSPAGCILHGTPAGDLRHGAPHRGLATRTACSKANASTLRRVSELAGVPSEHEALTGRTHSRCRMWKGGAQSRCRCGRGAPSPGADVEGGRAPSAHAALTAAAWSGSRPRPSYRPPHLRRYD